MIRTSIKKTVLDLFALVAHTLLEEAYSKTLEYYVKNRLLLVENTSGNLLTYIKSVIKIYILLNY